MFVARGVRSQRIGPAGHCERSEAIQSHRAAAHGLPRRCASRNDGRSLRMEMAPGFETKGTGLRGPLRRAVIFVKRACVFEVLGCRFCHPPPPLRRAASGRTHSFSKAIISIDIV